MRSASLLADFPRRRWKARRPRTVTLSRGTVLAGLGALLFLAAWSAASLWYFASRDEVALSFLERQAEVKRSYEDKLLALRTRLDQVTSQRMVEQEAIEGRLQGLLARQASFETRQGLLRSLADRTGAAASAEPDGGVSAYAPTPRPFTADPLQLRLGDGETRRPERRSDLDRFKSSLDEAEARLAALESRQRDTAEILASRVEGDGRRLQTALRKAGLDANAEGRASGNLGGPLVPVSAEGGAFETLVQRAEIGLARLQRLRRSVAALPFAEPIRGEIDLSSGFGYRVDPFTRGPAMHTGLDFRAEHGAPARATGSGRVVSADYSGAYGNMVEIEHAQGVTSRYAHLSSIAVTVGQEVKSGAVVGRVGSTGRSTGPHLHYETRINGEAVDPQRFLKIGATLTPLVTASR